MDARAPRRRSNDAVRGRAVHLSDRAAAVAWILRQQSLLLHKSADRFASNPDDTVGARHLSDYDGDAVANASDSSGVSGFKRAVTGVLDAAGGDHAGCGGIPDGRA